MEDVAATAGVSMATVSRYVNKSGFVAATTGARISAAIESLSYVPNQLAGELASQRSRLVALLVPYLSQSPFNATIDALVAALSEDGYVVMLGLTGPDEANAGSLIQAALSRQADAIILTGAVPGADLRQTLLRHPLTVIETWDLPETPLDVAIGFSHHDAGRQIATYLHGRGYRRPLLPSAWGLRAARRREGFLEAWVQLGGGRVQQLPVEGPSRFGQAQALFEQIMGLAERPDVIVCGADSLAQGVLNEAQAAGLKVPQDLAIFGFGDLAFAAETRPSISTVAIDGHRIGHEAVALLRARMRGEEDTPRRIDVGFRLIPRESA